MKPFLGRENCLAAAIDGLIVDVQHNVDIEQARERFFNTIHRIEDRLIS